MRVICPNCDAQYEVAEDAIPPEGRDVQCSNCGHAWFQAPLLSDAGDETAAFDPPPAMAVPTATPEPAVPEPVVPEPVVTIAPAPQPEPAPAADPAPEAVPAEPAPPALTAAPRRRLDDTVLSVLREEAEFEARARARETPRPLETQGDLGLDSLPPVAAVPDRAEPVEPAVRAPKGRDLLPDIEEINSTLRPVPPGTGRGLAGDGQAVAAARRGFGAGFGLALGLGVTLAVVYLLAPRLAAQVPALAGPLSAYADAVDVARVALDGAIQRAIGLIQG